MDREEVRLRLGGLLEALLDCDPLALEDGMTAADVNGWDSLAHLRLTVAVENEFAIRFKINQLEPPPTVGAYIDLIRTIRDAKG
jgi:acyl carrier protein